MITSGLVRRLAAPLALLLLLLCAPAALASEADLAIPDLHAGTFFGGSVSAWTLLFCGALVICGTLGISLYLRTQIEKLPAHKSMLGVAEIIFQTCKTYLIQQGKFLLMLFVLIACAITFYLCFGLISGHKEEYELSDRTVQTIEFDEKGKTLPTEVIASLKNAAKAKDK